MIRRAGFTLVEVVASLVLASVTLVAIINLFMMNAKVSHINMQRVIAYNLLQKKFEELRLRGLSTDVTQVNFTYPSDPGYSIDVSQIWPYLGNNYLKRIDATISWNTVSGGSVSESVSTLLADY